MDRYCTMSLRADSQDGMACKPPAVCLLNSTLGAARTFAVDDRDADSDVALQYDQPEA